MHQPVYLSSLLKCCKLYVLQILKKEEKAKPGFQDKVIQLVYMEDYINSNDLHFAKYTYFSDF